MDNEEKENIVLTENEGAIILRDEGMPEIYAPIGVGDTCDNIRFTLAFILMQWTEKTGLKNLVNLLIKYKMQRATSAQ